MIGSRSYTVSSGNPSCMEEMVIPSFRQTSISIPECHDNVYNSYRFFQILFTVISIFASCEVRSGFPAHGDGDSSWTCLGLVKLFILSNRLHVKGGARKVGRRCSEILAIIQSKNGKCQISHESKSYSHIARKEFT
jgi:hypothetical protein